MQKMNNFGCQAEAFGCDYWTNGNQKPLLASQNDLSIHFLDVTCNGQVATYGCDQ
jgi:hypothetical protein